jgi:hypothetical protein
LLHILLTMSLSRIQRATALVVSEWNEDDDEYQEQGTAFIISTSHLLTAYHVVSSAKRITVTFINNPQEQRTNLEAKLVRFDKDIDMAVLELLEPVSTTIVPLPLTSKPLQQGDTWQTYGFPASRLLTGQTIHGQALQFDGLPNQSWTLSTKGIAPTTKLKGLSGAPCVHEGFVCGIMLRREEQNICEVSIDNFASILNELSITIYSDPLEAPGKAIIDAIQLQQLPPFNNASYIDRIEFSSLFDELRNMPFLLLSGDSFCGKSTLAKRLMLEFWSVGYRYLITNDPYEARRFLSERSRSICLLDDPYGHTLVNENPSNWKLVKEVCSEIQGDNKLLITSKRDAILHANDVLLLSDCKINGKDWYDLTVKDRPFLLTLWEKVQEHTPDLDQEVTAKVKAHLEKDEGILLQPGHLTHLAAEDSEKLIGKSFRELHHIAMADARELSNGIKNRGDEYWLISVCLALTCNTIKSVKIEDLCYVLNQNTTPDASLEEKRTFFASKPFIDGHNEPDHLPEYDRSSPLVAEAVKVLNFFEEKGYIVNSGDCWHFSHPHYYEAAAYSMLGIRQRDQKKRLISYVSFSISCLNDNSAYLCAEQLPHIYRILDDNQLRHELITIAEIAFTRSIFFKVRTKALIFLLSVFNALEEEVRSNVERRLMSDALNVTKIFWDRGIPFISKKYSFTLSSLFKQESNALENIGSTIEAGEFINDESIWQALITTGSSLEILKHSFNSNEGFIRSKATIEFFRQYHTFDKIEREFIALKLFDDEYPSVVVEAIKSIFEFASKQVSQEDIDFLKLLIVKSLSNQFVVLRLRTFLMTFGISHGNESMDWKHFTKEEATVTWLLWGDIFPDFMDACQAQDVNFSSGRYSDTLRLASKYIIPEQAIRISKAIWQWIKKTIVIRELDTHELTCIDFLLTTVNVTDNRRIEIFQDFFSHADTGLTCYNLRYAIDAWASLSIEEQQIINNLLQQDRPDRRWLKAAAATSNGKLPEELQVVLFGEPSFFSRDISDIVRLYPVDFLIDCLRMFCAIPDFPFWQYALHGSIGSIWRTIGHHILRNQLTGFEICIPDLLHHVVNTPGREWEGWEAIWEVACSRSPIRDFLLLQLIIQTGSASVSLNPTKKLWEIIHQSYVADGNLEQFVKIISKNIDILENTGHPEDVIEVIPLEIWLEDIYAEFPGDTLAFNFLFNLEKSGLVPSEQIDVVNTQIDDLAKEIKIYPARLYLTYIYSKNVIKSINQPQLNLDKLQFHYNLTSKAGAEKIEQLRYKEREEIRNWVFTTQYLSRYNS